MPPSEHDAFHPPTSDDPWWQETAWFTLMVPERKLYCYVYPWVKANQGILGGGVMVWDDRGRHPWDALHWDYQWTYPYPELGDLRDITFPTGIAMRCVEPLHEVPGHVRAPALLVRRHVRRDPPRARPRRTRTTRRARSPGTSTSRVMSPAASRSTVSASTSTATRCATARGAGGCPRPGLHIGYDLCAEARSAFVVFSQPDAPGSPVVENFGYLWRDGEQLPLRRGSRVLERDGVWPRRVIVRAARRRAGARSKPSGTVVNHMGFQNLPSMMNLVGLVRWEYEGSDGAATEAWGEFEDVWDVERYRRFAREHA